jgi:hypothetical protein
LEIIKERKLSYLEFKLNKEMAYESTYGKDEEIQKQYQKYLKDYDERQRRRYTS